MASSSRTKKQRSNMSQSKQGTSSLESNPLNLTRLLANNEQRKVFEEHFSRISQSQQSQNAISHQGETTLAQARILQYRPGFHPPMVLQLPWSHNLYTKILEHFGVSTDGETKVALNLRERKIDVEVVHKMGLSIDPIDLRTYKHRTNKPTAPTADQPEPTNPNPSQFHAQSSSSAAMPSNQMLMDELFSLRGYITNRMDALDV
ncbi:hypothetical protein Lal_00042894 [Lupinus albus]|nr:hypothetical protein Lal_00042894 [Lupinus albus]